ncbi:hypothetical protein NRB_28340 [Novosphingobium sp. 11B]
MMDGFDVAPFATPFRQCPSYLKQTLVCPDDFILGRRQALMWARIVEAQCFIHKVKGAEGR